MVCLRCPHPQPTLWVIKYLLLEVLKIELSEKYRPKSLDELIGQEEIAESIKSRDHPKNYLFIGPPGCGKTTLAKILADRYNLPLIEKNASDERGIDTIREDIKRLVMTRGKKILLLDEADQMTPQAQNALRSMMENPKSETFFVLTGNDGWNLIEAIKSRCTDFEFRRLTTDDVVRRLAHICRSEGIDVDSDAREALIQLVEQVNGDMRKAINTLEKIVGKDKKITKKAVLSFLKPKTASNALKIALEGDFEKAKSLIEDAYLENRYSPKHILFELYDSIETVEKREWKILLYRELSNVERSIKREADPILPLVQFVGFIAYAWIIPHFPDSFKELKK